MVEVLLSTLLMGLLLIAVFVAISRSGQRATPSGQSGGRIGFAEWSGREDYESRLTEIATSPLAWTASFISLTIVFLAGAVLLVQGVPDDVTTEILQTVMLGIGGTILVSYIFYGSYVAVRERSGNSAAGVAVAATVIGVLMLIGVTLVLVFG